MTVAMEDCAAITALGAAYAALLDARRFEELSMLFCIDGMLHRADGSIVQGRAAVLAAQSARPLHLETVHHVAPPFVEVIASGQITGRTTFVALSKDRRTGAASNWTIGAFEDIYRHQDGAWRITRRRVSVADRMSPVSKETTP